MTYQSDIVTNTLAEVDAHCKLAKISPSDFGEMVANDRSLIHDMRENRRSPRVSTIDKIRAYIAANPPPKQEETVR